MVGFCVGHAAGLIVFESCGVFFSEYFIHSEITGGKSEVAFLKFCEDICVYWSGTGMVDTGTGTIIFVSDCTFSARVVCGLGVFVSVIRTWSVGGIAN